MAQSKGDGGNHDVIIVGGGHNGLVAATPWDAPARRCWWGAARDCRRRLRHRGVLSWRQILLVQLRGRRAPAADHQRAGALHAIWSRALCTGSAGLPCSTMAPHLRLAGRRQDAEATREDLAGRKTRGCSETGSARRGFGDLTAHWTLDNPPMRSEVIQLFETAGEEELLDEFLFGSTRDLLSRYFKSPQIRGFYTFFGIVSIWGGTLQRPARAISSAITLPANSRIPSAAGPSRRAAWVRHDGLGAELGTVGQADAFDTVAIDQNLHDRRIGEDLAAMRDDAARQRRSDRTHAALREGPAAEGILEFAGSVIAEEIARAGRRGSAPDRDDAEERVKTADLRRLEVALKRSRVDPNRNSSSNSSSPAVSNSWITSERIGGLSSVQCAVRSPNRRSREPNLSSPLASSGEIFSSCFSVLSTSCQTKMWEPSSNKAKPCGSGA